MNTQPKLDRAWLLATAKVVAKQLKIVSKGTRLRIRIPKRAFDTYTDGWNAVIGNLGKGQPRLEVWFDRFSGYSERKLYACFRSDARPQIISISKRVASKLWPVRIVNMKDTEENNYFVLTKRLARSDFNKPILEKYNRGETFYGIYDPTRETAERVNPHFCTRAVAFFEDVARALPRAKTEEDHSEDYSHYENRKKVASHLYRERSKLLPAECKIRDNYKCQICGLRYVNDYGKLGKEYAEAHHIIPLSKLRENVKTRVEDLTTVGANCHRMLHRMEGRSEDIIKLKAIVRRHKK